MILNYSLELGFAQDSTIIKTNQGKTILPLLVKKQKHEEEKAINGISDTNIIK